MFGKSIFPIHSICSCKSIYFKFQYFYHLHQQRIPLKSHTPQYMEYGKQSNLCSKNKSKETKKWKNTVEDPLILEGRRVGIEPGDWWRLPPLGRRWIVGLWPRRLLRRKPLPFLYMEGLIYAITLLGVNGSGLRVGLHLKLGPKALNVFQSWTEPHCGLRPALSIISGHVASFALYSLENQLYLSHNKIFP